MREWNRRGLVTAQGGKPPTRQSVITIMRNPRNAGLAVLPGRDGKRHGEEAGRGEWEPILAEETWRAVDGLLADPARKPPKGVRTLLGGIAACPCGNVVEGGTNHRGDHVYRCRPATRGDRPGPHVAVRAALVDEWVEASVLDELSRRDLADLVTPPPHVDTAGLRAEAAAIRRNLDEMGADRAVGLVSRSQMLAATERGNARLAEIGTELAEAAGAGALAPFTARAGRPGRVGRPGPVPPPGGDPGADRGDPAPGRARCPVLRRGVQGGHGGAERPGIRLRVVDDIAGFHVLTCS